MPAAPAHPAVTGSCKVLPRTNGWRAILCTLTKRTELRQSGTLVDLFPTKHEELSDFIFFSKTASTVATNHRVSHGTVCIFCAHRIENRGALRDREQCCYCAAQPPEAMQSLTRISALLLLFLQARPKRLQKTSSMSSTWAASSQQGERHL